MLWLDSGLTLVVLMALFHRHQAAECPSYSSLFNIKATLSSAAEVVMPGDNLYYNSTLMMNTRFNSDYYAIIYPADIGKHT